MISSKVAEHFGDFVNGMSSIKRNCLTLMLFKIRYKFNESMKLNETYMFSRIQCADFSGENFILIFKAEGSETLILPSTSWQEMSRQGENE